MQKFNKNICTLWIIILLIFTSCTNKFSENEINSENNIENMVESENNVTNNGNIIDENNDEVKEEIAIASRALPILEEPLSLTNVELLHTRVTIALYDIGDEQLINECFQLIDYYEKLISRSEEMKDTSEIYKLNNAGGEVVTLSDEVLECLQYGIDYSKSSNNTFDITVGQLTSLWDFTSDNEQGIKPSDEDIAAALSTIDIDNIVIEGNDVYLKNPDTRIDLGGIAKGFIADKVAEYLVKEGVQSAFINLGGNVLIVGNKPNNSSFKVGISEPVINKGENVGLVEIVDMSVVSSGDYEKFFYDENGDFYFHILDPKTGYPVVSDLAQATIISKKSVTGDGLSTAVFSMGSIEGLNHVENIEGVDAILIKKDGTILKTSGINDEDGIVFKEFE